jgi:hypothetical protein
MLSQESLLLFEISDGVTIGYYEGNCIDMTVRFALYNGCCLGNLSAQIMMLQHV